jgi:2-polyprenyl-3-methyl-5-hydroxy-6-metoxy-1,4-benzoquinol methylase
MMDQPDLPLAERRLALSGLKRVNYFCSAVPLTWRFLRRIAMQRGPAEPLRVLDVGSGGGDWIIRLAKRATAAELPMILHGCDMNPTAVSLATKAAQRARVSGVEFFGGNVLSDALPGPYDVVMCSLFLHHFSDDEAEEILKRMAAASTHAVLVDDLLRTRLGYVLCRVGSQIISRSHVVHVDGPLSVRAAFTLPEAKLLAERSGLTGAVFRQHWPQRFLMQWTRP